MTSFEIINTNINNIELENEYVYNTYQNIADDFSSSRYKVWDSVKEFLDKIEVGSKILEVGCGNGKNLLYRKDDLQSYGCDISDEFVMICKERGLNVEKGNNINLNYETNYFDNTMSVAVIHHISSQERRIQAIKELVRVTKPGGIIFIEVWAMKQDKSSRFNFTDQDILVPFKDKASRNILGKRFYHIYKDGELEKEIEILDNIKIIKKFYEKGNWGIILEKLIL
jgi:SAM-dependent methyltransferase